MTAFKLIKLELTELNEEDCKTRSSYVVCLDFMTAVSFFPGRRMHVRAASSQAVAIRKGLWTCGRETFMRRKYSVSEDAIDQWSCAHKDLLRHLTNVY